MKLSHYYDAALRERVVTFSLTDADMQTQGPGLSLQDLAILKKCDAPDAAISTRLLGLSIVAKMVESAAASAEGDAT